MKVLVDCRGIWPGRSGGIENFTYIVVEALSDRGVDIEIDVCEPHVPWFQDYFSGRDNVSFIADPTAGNFARRYFEGGVLGKIHAVIRRLGTMRGTDPMRRRAWAQRQQADVVFYPGHRSPPQYDHLPFVTTIHAILPEYEKRDMDCIEEHVTGATAATCSWPHPHSDLIERFPPLSDKLAMIPFTVSQNTESAEGFDLTTLGVDPEVPFFFYPALVMPRKNHENLIRGYAEALKQGHSLPMVVCSGGGDALLRQRLIKLATSLGVGDQFKFVGYVSKEAMGALYAQCLGTVAPTIWEAGMAIFQEGCSLGKPAACADMAPARAHAELLDLKAAFFKPDSPSDIAKVMIEFHENLESYRQSAEAASHVIRGMDKRYLGACYEAVLSTAAGLTPKPDWWPYRHP